ncbi:MAG TPA: DUF438 domain-containing protein [Firmicutes bacterium]|nr:DUF438 domain-containing protein [Bacillota bacterium]
MKLTPKTKISALLSEHPYLTDWLAEYNPKFAGLKNPVLRATIGRMANLAKVAVMGEVPLADLLAAIAKRIREEGGAVEIDLGDAPATAEARREVLKGIIRDLHAGTPMDQLKQRFAELIEDVSPSEIAQMEQQLIDEGMPQEEIKRLCDVHVEVFRESLDQQSVAELPPGHPVRTFMDENEALGQVATELETAVEGLCEPAKPGRLELAREPFAGLLDKLATIELHYLRKENQLFPFLEQAGISGPPQVMWGIHDEVRAELKQVRAALEAGEAQQFADMTRALLQKINDMIYKENNILFPMSLSVLSEEDWVRIRDGEGEIGFALVEPGGEWVPSGVGHGGDEELRQAAVTGALPLDTGLLSLERINLLLTHLPVEISYTDEDDIVRYYSATSERVFPRSPGVIGRKVEHCHPPKSVHMVKQILNSFRAGERDVAVFWIDFKDRKIHIRYFAIRDGGGKFKGTMEVIQDVTDIMKLEGERRLLEWD